MSKWWFISSASRQLPNDTVRINEHPNKWPILNSFNFNAANPIHILSLRTTHSQIDRHSKHNERNFGEMMVLKAVTSLLDVSSKFVMANWRLLQSTQWKTSNVIILDNYRPLDSAHLSVWFGKWRWLWWIGEEPSISTVDQLRKMFANRNVIEQIHNPNGGHCRNETENSMLKS